MCLKLAVPIVLLSSATLFADGILTYLTSRNIISQVKHLLTDSPGKELCLNENNLSLGGNQPIVILARRNSTNDLNNEVLKILLTERLGYAVNIESVNQTFDVRERLKSERNIICIDTLQYPKENEMETEDSNTSVNIPGVGDTQRKSKRSTVRRMLAHHGANKSNKKDQKEVDVSANKTGTGDTQPKYVKIVSEELPPIIHKLVQNLEVKESNDQLDAFGTDSFCSSMPHHEYQDFVPVACKACDWIKWNRKTVDRLIPRINPKIAVIYFHYGNDDWWSTSETNGLTIDNRYVSRHSKVDSSFLRQFESDVVGIIATKPFTVKKEIDIPAIYYDADYLSPENLSVFPYTFNDISYETYKYALCDFMESLNWSRIAIVSDSSEFSVVLNDDLAPHLRARKILYKIEECPGIPCDFTEILKALMDQDARIILANVYEDNMMSLSTAAKKLGMDHGRYIWILRQKPPYENMFNHYFIVSLSPFEDLKSDDDCFVSKIDRSLSKMISIYRETITNPNALFYNCGIIDGWMDYLKDEFKKNFLKNRRGQGDVQTVCVKNMNYRSVYTYKYNSKGEKIYSSPYVELYHSVPSDRSQCITNTNTSVYFTPCKDELMVIILLVVLAFVVTSALLVVLTKNVNYLYHTKYEIL